MPRVLKIAIHINQASSLFLADFQSPINFHTLSQIATTIIKTINQVLHKKLGHIFEHILLGFN
jgi:hypothetical protein